MLSTVLDPGTSDDKVTAVNNEDQIAGFYKTGPGTYSSFTFPCTSTKSPPITCVGTAGQFKSVFWPGSTSTNLTAKDTTDPDSYAAGYVDSPPHTTTGITCTTCGILYDDHGKGSWIKPLLQDPSEGPAGSGCAQTRVLGINGAKVAVGYYEKPPATGTVCTNHAFEEYLFNNKQKFVDLDPGASDTIARGIDNGGDVVGTAMVQVSGKSVMQGWYYNDGVYQTFNIEGSTINTQPTGVSWGGDIVGNYTDSRTHGFFLIISSNYQISTQQYTPIDYTPNGSISGSTFINSITPAHTNVAGWFIPDGSNDAEGIVGTCTAPCASTGTDSASEDRARPSGSEKRPARSRP